MRIAAIETREFRFPLDPPFHAAWDPAPRTHQDATLVVVRSDDGVEGYASGDAVPDRALLERLLVGTDPADTRVVHRVVETVDFHHGRNWTVEVAVWDLLARAQHRPLWELLGPKRDAPLLAYASTGELVSPEERVRRCLALREQGIRAVKIRLHQRDWREDVPVLEAVRSAVGDDLAIMVDANQGWRMPGDVTPPWSRDDVLELVGELERLDVYWLEEPLATDEADGYAELRGATQLRLAAGEMARSAAEARALVLRGRIDVLQTDVVLAGGIEGARTAARLADENGATWSPHTWSNGYGLLANLQAAHALSTCPYLEVPYDPPGWSPERRDWLLPFTLEIAQDGTIEPPAGPGLGIVPDFDRLEQYRVG
jgi:D-galactarolactone cycloisomerase